MTVYRSRADLVAPSLVYLLLEAWLAPSIVGRGCPGTITFDDLIPVVGVIGAGALLALGTLHRRREELALGACLGVAVVVGLIAFYGAYSAFYCM
jgi:hypothetical protein